MIKKIFCLSLVFIFSIVQIGFAMGQRPPSPTEREGFDKQAFIESAKSERVLRIGLIDCVAYSLKNNSEVKIERIKPKLRADDERIAGAEFEPTFSLDYNIKDTKNISQFSEYFTPTVATSRTTDFNVGVGGKIVTGTEYNIDFLNKKYKSNASSFYEKLNPYYTAEPKITITQPLFRGFGILVNRADIIISQNTKEMSRDDFKDMVMDTITKTQAVYYDYIYYLEQYAIAKLYLERTQKLLEVNKARYLKGLVSSVALLETEAAVAEREKAVITSEFDVETAEDDLKYITNLVDDPEVWNASLELIDKPKFIIQEIDLAQAIEAAFEYRPDYHAAKIDLDNRDIKVKVARNALLPTVNFVGGYGVDGLGPKYKDALNIIDNKYKDWSVGVKVSYPWGSDDRARYDQRKLEKTQAWIAFDRLGQKIVLDIRERVRDVDIQQRQVEVATIAREREMLNYEAQKERYAAGYVSTHDMLDYQNKLSRSELDYVKSLIDYNIAVIELEKAQGLTLVKNNVILEEP